MRPINRIVLTSTVFFFIASLILNIVWNLVTGVPHYSDIIHIYPMALFTSIVDIYGISMSIMSLVGGILAVLTDTLVGFLFGLIINKIPAAKPKAFIIIAVSFVIYFFLICFQFLPII
ncbi:hypothetical protein [Candidatus Epulonipiscium viviparus]|uniref:hypothetical protein n=1 Tax=Candidatus Epulonipiscium viviparus TaxID=420336 RepID=UPI0027380C62|nr:hypothetical protein [Candidatus Epulopiscium viviparus]